MLTFDELQTANRLRSLQWDPEAKLTPMFFAVELAGELGEACNIIKKLERERMGLRGSRATKADLKEELADIVIVVSLLAEACDIDLAHAVIEKFNKTSNKLNLEVRL